MCDKVGVETVTVQLYSVVDNFVAVQTGGKTHLEHRSGESVVSPDQDYSFGCTSVELTGPTLGKVGRHLATSELVSGLKVVLVQNPGFGLIPHLNSGLGFGLEQH